MEFGMRIAMMLVWVLSFGAQGFGAELPEEGGITSPSFMEASALFGKAERRLLDLPERLQYGEKLSAAEKSWAQDELAREAARLDSPAYADAVLAAMKETYPGGRVILSRWGESDDLISVSEYADVWRGEMKAKLAAVGKALQEGAQKRAYTREEEESLSPVEWGPRWAGLFEIVWDGEALAPADLAWARAELKEWRADLAADGYQAKETWFLSRNHPSGKILLSPPGESDEIVGLADYALRERSRQRREIQIAEGMLRRGVPGKK